MLSEADMFMWLSLVVVNAEQPFKLWWAHICEQLERLRLPKHSREGTCHDTALWRKAWCALRRGRSLCVEAATGWEVLLL